MIGLAQLGNRPPQDGCGGLCIIGTAARTIIGS